MHLELHILLLGILAGKSQAWLPSKQVPRQCVRCRLSDDWSSFQAVDEDDEIVYGRKIDRTDYATENDNDAVKATVGASLSAPTIERDAEPIFLPAGKSSASIVLFECPHLTFGDRI